MSEAKQQEEAASDPSVRVEGDVRGTAHQLIHPQTVGELRRFLEPFADDCQLMAMNWGAFRYVLDGEGNGIIQYT
jgi:hypothetical protein